MTPSGQFDFETARRSGYQGALDLTGVEMRLEGPHGTPRFTKAGRPDSQRLSTALWLPNWIGNGVDPEPGPFVMTEWNGNLVVGGDFSQAGETGGWVSGTNNIAMWDSSTGWSEVSGGVSGGVVRALATWGPDLIVGGTFTQAGASTMSGDDRIARWNGTAWNSMGSGFDDGAVWDIEEYNGELYAAGTFTASGGTAMEYVARWDSVGSTWTSVASANFTGSGVYVLEVFNGKLHAAGSFTSVNGSSVSNMAAYDAGLDTWSSIGGIASEGALGRVRAMRATDDGNFLYVGGDFSQVAGSITVNYVARWDGGGWFSLTNGLDAPVFSLEQYQNGMYAGGEFIDTNSGLASNYVARWDIAGSNWSALGSGVPGTDAMVTTMVGYDSQLFVGGEFSVVGDLTGAQRFASWDGTNWSALDGDGMSSTVHALALYEGLLIAGGTFSAAGTTPASGIAGWNGADWINLGAPEGVHYEQVVNCDTPGEVYALVVHAGLLYVGGKFTCAGAVPVLNVATWDFATDAWAALPNSGAGLDINGSCNTSTSTDPPVAALAVHDGAVVAGGSFNRTFDGSTATCVNHVAQYTGAEWVDLGDGLDDGAGDGSVLALVVYRGNLVAGGDFTNSGGVSLDYIASWNGAAWNGMGSPGFDAPVRALAASNADPPGRSDLFAGGDFTGHLAWNTLGNWSSMGTPNGSVRSLAVRGSFLYVGGGFTEITEANNPLYPEPLPASRIARVPIEPAVDDNGQPVFVWEPLSSGVDHVVETIFPDEANLFVGGRFVKAGVTYSAYIAEAQIDDVSSTPTATSLQRIDLVTAPNPFRNVTRVNLISGSSGAMSIQVFDARGRLVRSLFEGHIPSGSYFIDWDGFDARGRALPQGVYFVRVVHGSDVARHKLIHVR